MWTSTSVPFQPDGRLILLSNGTVLAHAFFPQTSWWRLTPDASGNYAGGTWSHGPEMPHYHLSTSPSPLLAGSFAIVGDQSLDLTREDGRYIEGPIEILSVGGGAWTSSPVLTGWSAIAATICAMPDGSILAADFEGPPPVSPDGRLRRWTQVDGWSDAGSLPGEETVLGSLTLLRDGSVLALGQTLAYRMVGGAWVTEGPHGLRPTDSTSTIDGPVTLLPDGRVLAIDAQGGLALRDLDGAWRAAGQVPDRDGRAPSVYAASACVLPNGRVLFAADHANVSDDLIYDYVTYYEWHPDDGTLVAVGGAAPDGTASFGTTDPDERGMLVLPDGTVMVTRIFDIAFYRPDPPAVPPPWGPRITAVAEMPRDNIVIVTNQALSLTGDRLSGAGQGCYAPYGLASPTNYPLVRLEYADRTIYLTTSNHSSLAVNASGETTTFAAPADLPIGAATLCVVVNGVADCVPVVVRRPPDFHGYTTFQKLLGSLADGQLWVLRDHHLVPQPSGPGDPAIVAAYERIMNGLVELARGAEDPLVARDAQRLPGMHAILSGLRALAAQGARARPWKRGPK